MHEMGIALEIVDIVRASLPPGVAEEQVTGIRLRVGRLSTVVPASLRFCFEAATCDGGLAAAELIIEEVPVVAVCGDCGHRWTIASPAFVCPACRGGHLDLVSGRELDVEAIDIIQKDVSHDPAAAGG